MDSQRIRKRFCSGISMRPSPTRSTATEEPAPKPRSSRYCLGIVSCPFSPIRVFARYSTCDWVVDMVQPRRNILPHCPPARLVSIRDLIQACVAGVARELSNPPRRPLLSALSLAHRLRPLLFPTHAGVGSSCESPEPSRHLSIQVHTPDRRTGPRRRLIPLG